MLYIAEMSERSIGKRIAEARRAAGLTQAVVAQQLRVSPQAVSQWERNETLPDFDKLAPLCMALEIPIADLIHNTMDQDTRLAYLNEAGKLAEKRKFETASTADGRHLVGARDFPIYAAAQGGEGFMIVHTDVMEYVKRPVILEGVPNSYGVLVVGESMIPAYRPGDMALVHPRRPPERDTDVILYDHDHRTGDAKSMIKRLVGYNDRSYKLEQYNPAKTFSEHKADWPICHQVVGMYKGRN